MYFVKSTAGFQLKQGTCIGFVRCYILSYFGIGHIQISFRDSSLALGQSYDVSLEECIS